MMYYEGKFTAYASPTINITKWYDESGKVCFYDLYINTEYDARYDSFESLMNRLSLMIQFLGGSNL